MVMMIIITVALITATLLYSLEGVTVNRQLDLNRFSASGQHFLGLRLSESM